MLRVAVVLAGGMGRRMGWVDKGLVTVNGVRMIDRIHAALSPQVDRILISGRHDYELGLPVIADRIDGPQGPAAGLYAASRWIGTHLPDAAGFVTVPVDAPNIPGDLILRLSESSKAAVAADEAGTHPTFGHWPVDRLSALWSGLDLSASISLHQVARWLDARTVSWPGRATFLNVNTPEDLAAAGGKVDMA